MSKYFFCRQIRRSTGWLVHGRSTGKNSIGRYAVHGSADHKHVLCRSTKYNDYEYDESTIEKKKSCKNSALSVQRQGVEHLADDSCCQLYPVQHRPAVCTCVVFAGRTAAWGQWGEKESPAVRALTCRRNCSDVPLRIPRTIGVCWPSGLFSIIIIIIFSNIIFLSFVHVGTST